MKTKNNSVERYRTILFQALRNRADRHAAAWAGRGFPAKRGSGPRVDKVTADMVQDAQSAFFAAAAGEASDLFRAAVEDGWQVSGRLLRWIANHRDVVGAGYKAAGQWFRSEILRDSGRWVDAPDLDMGEAGEDDEDFSDLDAMRQVAAEFDRPISHHRAGLLRDVRHAAETLGKDVALRIAAATSGAAAAAVRRSAGSDLALLNALAGFLERGEPLAAMDWEKLVVPSGRGLSPLGRTKASRLKARLA